MELIVLVGIPASGKSYIAQQYAQRGYHVHSSDAIRKELYGAEIVQGKPADVFDVLFMRLRADLKEGHSCVVDATNMRRKRRMNMLHHISTIQCTRKCILVLAPIEECMRRNQERSRTVEEQVIIDMLRSFEVPARYEGWDCIEAVCSGGTYAFPFEQVMDFSQDNPHHTLTLGAHMAKAEAFCMEQGYAPEICEAARYHDCGKLYTKQFCNARGVPTETAHYFGHEGCSAYLYLCEMAKQPDWERTLWIANIINWHMAPLNRWKTSEKTRAHDL